MSVSLRVKINSARNLPIMDRSTYLTDAFVEVRIGSSIYKTEVVRRTLNPVWNADWFFFQIHDNEINSECLQIRVFDHDTYSAHDAIGRVYFDIYTILSTKKCIDGWFPIYDPMHGIRGEINLVISLDLISFASKCLSENHVKIFNSPILPYGYQVISLIGFVQEIMVIEDPEHQWIEKIRTPRASNEARQRLFSKISRDIQSKLCKIVLNHDGNSILGFQQHFDLEGETGVIVRAIGCAANLIKIKSEDIIDESTDHKINVYNNGEFPLFTLTNFPSDILKSFGSYVNVMSVKLINKDSTASIQHMRDAWWMELRTEITSNMRAINCNAIIGYREECCIFDDVCILWSYGTAVHLSSDSRSNVYTSPHSFNSAGYNAMHQGFFNEPINEDGPKSELSPKVNFIMSDEDLPKTLPRDPLRKRTISAGPSIGSNSFFSSPNVIFSTGNFPENLDFNGLPGFIQTSVCRSRKDYKGEIAAKELNNVLPCIEFELYYRLAQTIKLKGFNSIFGIKVNIVMSESMIIAVLTGTGYHLNCLSEQQLPKVVNYEYPTELGHDDIQKLSRKMNDFRKNSEAHYCIQVTQSCESKPMKTDLNQERVDSQIEYLLSCRQIGINELAHFLRDTYPPDGILVSTTETLLSRNIISNWLKSQKNLNISDYMDVREDSEEELLTIVKKLSIQDNNGQDIWQNVERYMMFNVCEIWLADSFFETRTCPDELAVKMDDIVLKPKMSILKRKMSKIESRGRLKPLTEFKPNSIVNNRPCSASNFSQATAILGDPKNESLNKHPQGCLSHALNTFNVENWSKLKSSQPCIVISTNSILFITQSNQLHVINVGITLKPSEACIKNSLLKTKSESAMKKMNGDRKNIYKEVLVSNSSTSEHQKSSRTLREDLTCKDLTSELKNETVSDSSAKTSKWNPSLGRNTKLFSTFSINHRKSSVNIVKKCDLSGWRKLLRKNHMNTCLDPIQLEIFTPLKMNENPLILQNYESPKTVIISPLTHIPNYTIQNYIGHIESFFIRESTDLRDCNGITGFIHQTVCEIEQVVTAHASSLGANAIVSYTMNDFKVIHSSVGGNSAMCLVNICGDMVTVS